MSGKLPTLTDRRIPSSMNVAETIPDINENAVLLEQFKLPDMMAGLLETAINDARGLDRYRYMPDSDHWYNTSNRSSCEVCLSGSVIARSFRIPPDRDCAPHVLRADHAQARSPRFHA